MNRGDAVADEVPTMHQGGLEALWNQRVGIGVPEGADAFSRWAKPVPSDGFGRGAVAGRLARGVGLASGRTAAPRTHAPGRPRPECGAGSVRSLTGRPPSGPAQSERAPKYRPGSH